jgi:hypothetical protein
MYPSITAFESQAHAAGTSPPDLATVTDTTPALAANPDPTQQPVLRAGPAQAGRLLAMATIGRPAASRPDAGRLSLYVDTLLNALEGGANDPETLFDAAVVIKQVIDRNARHVLPAMYGAARAVRKEQVLMTALHAGMDHYHGGNALCLAARLGHANVVKDLCALGMSLESRIPQNGRTPLIIAAIEGHDRVVGILLGQGAAVHAKDLDGRTALVHARQWLARGSMLFSTSLHDPELGMNWQRCVDLLEAKIAASC